jgi:hypothetical protein
MLVTVLAAPASATTPSPPTTTATTGAAASATPVRVFVVDGGVRTDHAAFGGRASAGIDVIGGAITPGCLDHGTALAGIAAASTTGVAPDAGIVSVRVVACDGSTRDVDLLAGLDWITAQGPGRGVVLVGPTVPAADELDAAVDHLVALGYTVVAAGGDEGADACARSPGRARASVTVGATDATGRRVGSSDWGTCLDLFALGVDVQAPSASSPTSTATVSGTAAAAALVAGAAAAYDTTHAGAAPADVAAALGDAARSGVVDAGRGSPDRLLVVAPSGSTPSTTKPSTTTPSTTVPSTTSSPPTSTTAPTPTPSTGAPPSSAGAAGQGQVGIASGTGVNGFARGGDGALWWRQLTNAGWTTWQSFGGSIVGTPSVATGAGGSVYVFARGADNALWWQGYNGSSWSGWQSFGGVLTSDPSAWYDGANLWVFVRGGDNALYYRQLDGGTWSWWVNAGGVLASRPAVTSDSAGVAVFVRGADNGLWGERISGLSPLGWGALGGVVIDDPAAATDSTGISVFVRGADNALYRQRLSGGAWLGYENLGGVLASAPSVVNDGSALDVFVRGSDSAPYWQRVGPGGPQGWGGLGGLVSGAPSATADLSGVTVFARGTDGYAYAQRYTGGWQGWGQLSGVPISSNVAALSAPEIVAGPVSGPSALGFDTCVTPSLSAMGTWRLYSPFTSIGIYIGGASLATGCGAGLGNATWVNTVVAQGWRVIPIYVGLQAPCNGWSAPMSADPGTASQQGTNSANDAADRASRAGIPPGSPIYFDLEGYVPETCSAAQQTLAVQSFMSGWVQQLHARGYGAAMYSSLCSGIRDMAAVYSNPAFATLDAIWVAAWAYNDQNDPRYASYQPNLFGYTGCAAPLNDNMWPYHQRLRQYRGGHTESWGGVAISIDSDAVDGPTYP